MTTGPAQYAVDLCQLLAECDTNYLRLCKLMPDMEIGKQRLIGVCMGDGQELLLCITVIDQAPYTTTLSLSQTQQIWGKRSPQMTVRVYHDASMAEVIAYQQVRAPRGRYEYPNSRMHAPDEKRQLNRLLGEWLGMCLEHGHEAEPVVLAQV